MLVSVYDAMLSCDQVMSSSWAVRSSVQTFHLSPWLLCVMPFLYIFASPVVALYNLLWQLIRHSWKFRSWGHHLALMGRLCCACCYIRPEFGD